MKLMIILTIIACFIISDYHAPHNSGLQLIKYPIDCIWPEEKNVPLGAIFAPRAQFIYIRRDVSFW